MPAFTAGQKSDNDFRQSALIKESADRFQRNHEKQSAQEKRNQQTTRFFDQKRRYSGIGTQSENGSRQHEKQRDVKPVNPRAPVQPFFEKGGGENVLRRFKRVIDAAVIRRNRQVGRMSQNDQRRRQNADDVVNGDAVVFNGHDFSFVDRKSVV